MEQADKTDKKTKYYTAGRAVERVIQNFKTNRDSSAVKAQLAALRRGLGKSPDQDPEVWGMVLNYLPENLNSGHHITNTEQAVFAALTLYARGAQGEEGDQDPEVWGMVLNYLPENLNSGHHITNTEQAVFAALTLYARGAQGEEGRKKPAQRDGVSLGQAMAGLVKPNKNNANKNNEGSVLTKIKSIMASKSIEEMSTRIRPLISMISEETGLDYPKLADELAVYFHHDVGKNIRMEWARDYVYKRKAETESDKENTENQ